MKKIMSMLVAGAMLAGTACTSTNTGTGSDTMSGSTGSASGTATGNATGTTTGGTTTSTGAGSTSTGSMSSGSATGTTGGSTTGTMSTGGGTTGSTAGGTGTATGGTTTSGTTIGVTGGGAGTAAGGAAGGTAGATVGAGATGTAGATMDLTNMTDAMFLMTAASSNLFEIQAGKLAAQSASNPEIKRFAQMMVDHHTKASQEQMSLASQMKVTLPKTLMPVHQTMLDRLKGKTGKGFDEDYMDIMEAAHKMDIAMFELKSTGAETPTVKAFATKGLPMLKSHQAMATKLEDTVD